MTSKSNNTNSNINLLGISDLSAEQIHKLLDLAESLVKTKEQTTYAKSLHGKTIAMLFYEPSTRTRASFSMAAYRLGANVMELSPRNSSEEKGETLIDTFLTLQAMRPDLFVLRHRISGIAHKLAERISIPIVNAGDGKNEHPSQTLLDLLTIRLHRGSTKNLKIAIVGDILHSRVARSFIAALNKLGVGELCLVGPKTLLPDDFATGNIQIKRDIESGIKNADVIMMLRLQQERMEYAYLPTGGEYFSLYGLSQERLTLASKDALVMHPGPFNRGMEISSAVADSSRSLILKQVEYGVFARMAIFLSILSEEQRKKVWQT